MRTKVLLSVPIDDLSIIDQRAKDAGLSRSEYMVAMCKGPCTCDQHGDFCPAHPTCACGCQRHAHYGLAVCVAGKMRCKMRCHGCEGYRPAEIRRFAELDDDAVELAAPDEMCQAYKALRAHHVEETTALWERLHRRSLP